MPRSARIGTLIATAWLAMAGPVLAEDSFTDFSELDLENLLDQVVVTASRRAQKVSEAPVATFVVSAEDIRSSGAATVPDALRLVPGLEVMSPNLTNSNVSARGLNEIAANTMMVLINGRSVYAEFYGVILWDMLPVDISDVKSIEVTRSPGSALYGANAFAGVINILTYDPGEDPGVSVATAAAEYGSNQVAGAVSGWRGDDVSYRVSGGYHHVDHVDPAGAMGYAPRFNADVRWDRDESSWSMSAGQAGGRSRSMPTALGSAIWVDGHHRYVRADHQRGRGRLRAYWNHFKLDLDPERATSFTPLADLQTDSFDLDYQRSHDLGDAHLLTWSANYRHNAIDWTILPQNYAQDIFGLAVNDEWRIGDRWIASGGVRYDHHPLVDGTVSPRASLVFAPRPRHTLRALVSQAHRNPTYLESYFRFEGISSSTGMELLLLGNQDLAPEEITAFEVGYQGMWTDDLMVTTDLFHNRMRDAVEITLVGTHPSPPAPVPGIPSEYQFLNSKDLDATGGEIAVGWTPTPRIRLLANYAYTWIEDAESDRRVLTAPRYKANLALTVRPVERVSFFAATRYVSETEFSFASGNSITTGSSGDYVVTDLRVGYETWERRVDLALGVHNAFDTRYREYAEGIEFRRRVFATVGARF